MCLDLYEFQYVLELWLKQCHVAIVFIDSIRKSHFWMRKFLPASCLTEGSRRRTLRKEAFAVSGSWSLPPRFQTRN